MGSISLVAYCGLYCPKCYRMRVSGAAKTLKTELDAAGKKGATYIEDCGEDFMAVLDKLIVLHCATFCRAREELKCSIQQCCIAKGLIGCWKCKQFKTCPQLTEQFIGNCDKIADLGVEGFVEQIESGKRGGYTYRFEASKNNEGS